ncbi:hypothetical protein IAQ61_007599 [Plenodomus lingam]|uniref:uncharacterized protein n=1 Tax=Leptosphaeria maculans TaxID=5022 RepID=UPI0033278537|nr:hypothetical protein IAQ61_007599 [Plenodomus lingam]
MQLATSRWVANPRSSPINIDINIQQLCLAYLPAAVASPSRFLQEVPVNNQTITTPPRSPIHFSTLPRLHVKSKGPLKFTPIVPYQYLLQSPIFAPGTYQNSALSSAFASAICGTLDVICVTTYPSLGLPTSHALLLLACAHDDESSLFDSNSKEPP